MKRHIEELRAPSTVYDFYNKPVGTQHSTFLEQGAVTITLEKMKEGPDKHARLSSPQGQFVRVTIHAEDIPTNIRLFYECHGPDMVSNTAMAFIGKNGDVIKYIGSDKPNCADMTELYSSLFFEAIFGKEEAYPCLLKQAVMDAS